MLHRKQIFTNQHSSLLQVDPNHPLGVNLMFCIPAFYHKTHFYDPVRKLLYINFLDSANNSETPFGNGPQNLYASYPEDRITRTWFSTTEFPFTNGFSFSCWLKGRANANGGYVGTLFNSSNSPLMYLNGITTSVWTSIASGASITTPKNSNCIWQHIVFTWDNYTSSSTGTLTLYDNGVKIGTGSSTNYNPVNAYWRFFTISATSNSSTFANYTSSIMTTWNRCLTSDEVSMLYQDPTCMLECSPEWYYYNPDLIAARIGIGKSPFRNFIHGER